MKAAMETITMPQFNLLLGWAWLLLAFVSGLLLGLFFHRENWLGGYSSLRRRLYRLAHISFFGLGFINLAFYMTAKQMPLSESSMSLAGWGFVIGSVAMPICCVLTAHYPATRSLFAIPVLSLLLGGSLTMAGLLHHYTRAGSATSPALTYPAPTESHSSSCGFFQSAKVSTQFTANASTLHNL